MDGSPPGSPVPGILQARTLEWVAISFSNAWTWKIKVKLLSCVRLCATPWTAAHRAPPSLGFSRQQHWSGMPFPSPMHESEKWKWSRSVKSDSQRPHGLQPTRLLRPWDFPGKSTGVGCHCLLHPSFSQSMASAMAHRNHCFCVQSLRMFRNSSGRERHSKPKVMNIWEQDLSWKMAWVSQKGRDASWGWTEN